METGLRRHRLEAGASTNKGKAFNAKLAPKYSGPFEVKKIHSPVMVDLRIDGVNGKGGYMSRI